MATGEWILPAAGGILLLSIIVYALWRFLQFGWRLWIALPIAVAVVWPVVSLVPYQFRILVGGVLTLVAIVLVAGFGEHSPRSTTTDSSSERPVRTRWDIIKRLARKRLKEQGAPDFVFRELDEASEQVLMGIPENTILTCAESLITLTSQGLTERQAFELIEKHRSQFVAGRRLPDPLTLATYVGYRLNLEGVPGPPISDEYLRHAADEALTAARAAFKD